MKKWTQLALTATAVATALAVGLTSASALGVSSTRPSSVASQTGLAANMVAAVAADPQTKPESLLVSVAPCRIVDTRLAVGALGNGATRTYYVGGTFGFAPQGGKSGGCGIPVGATAVAAVITAVSPLHGGYLKAYASGTAAPASSVLNYPAGLTIGSGVTVPLQTTSAQSLQIYNYAGPTQLIIDVQGYYIPQIQGLIGGDGSVLAGTSRIVSTSHPGTGSFYITLDRPARQCSPVVNTFNLYRYASVGLSSSTTPNTISVYIWHLDVTTHQEVPEDYPFFLTVTC